MPDEHIEFEEDELLVRRRLSAHPNNQQELHPGMIAFVMRKVHVDEKTAQNILLIVAGIFFIAAITIFVTRFVI